MWRQGGNKYAQPEPAKASPTERTRFQRGDNFEPTVATARSPAREQAAPGYSAGQPYQKQQGELYRQLVQPAAVSQAVEQPAKVSAPRSASTDEPLHGDNYSFGRVLTVFPPSYALIEYKQGVALALTVAERWLKQAQLNASRGFTPSAITYSTKTDIR